MQLTALIPRTRERGGSGPCFPEPIEILLKEYVDRFQSPLRPKRNAIYRDMIKEGLNSGIPANLLPSYATFCRRVAQLDPVTSTRRREGSAAAYQLGPRLQPGVDSDEQIYWLTHNTPPHGDYAMQRVHIDSTKLGIVVVDYLDGQRSVLGAPWLSIATDAYTRMVLGMSVSFRNPNADEVMRLLRTCVRDFQQLPATLIVDHGSEFETIALDQLRRAYKFTLLIRPARQPRAGSLIERMFGSTETEIFHQLPGNTQAHANHRQMTSTTDPSRLAQLSLQEVATHLRTFFDVYNSRSHSTLRMSPRDAWALSKHSRGTHGNLNVVNSDEFRFLTMSPVTRKGTRRVRPGYGILIKGLYYWNPVMAKSTLHGADLPVRTDPDQWNRALVEVGGEWLECKVRGTEILAINMDQRELADVRQFIRAQHRRRGKAITPREIEAATHNIRQADVVYASRREQEVASRAMLAQGRREDEGMAAPDAEPAESDVEPGIILDLPLGRAQPFGDYS
jgi:putative transposase